MELLSLSELSVDEEPIRVVKLTALKNLSLLRYSPETRNTITKIIDELVCEVIFQIHMELNIGVANPDRYCRRSMSPPNETFLNMAEELNVIKVNQDVDCPKCFVLVKCQWLSKHLAVCMNPHQSTYSYSSRNSSRIARQRIQEGFKTSYDESKNDSDDERVKPKRRVNKGRKTKVKCIR